MRKLKKISALLSLVVVFSLVGSNEASAKKWILRDSSFAGDDGCLYHVVITGHSFLGFTWTTTDKTLVAC